MKPSDLFEGEKSSLRKTFKKASKPIPWKKELIRLASLVGTDAKNPKEKLLQFIAKIKQEIREDAFNEGKNHERKEIERFINRRMALDHIERKKQEETR